MLRISAAIRSTILPLAFAMIVIAPSLTHAKEEDSATLSQTILGRYRTILLEQPLKPADELQSTLDSITDQGTWSDLDYADRRPAGWRAMDHLHRLRDLCQAWATPGQPLYQDKELREGIDLALDHWLEKRYRNHNWWYNKIGVPRLMRDIVVLLGEGLQGKQRQGAIEVVAQRGVGGTGANLAWQQELVLHHACLNGKNEQAGTAIRRIWKEVQVGAREGIQSDGSFFQHGPRLHNFGYGRSFLDIVVSLAWQTRDTPLAIPLEKRVIITNHLVEGMQWMSRGKYTPPSTIDRVISRTHSRKAADLSQVLRLWIEVDPQSRNKIEQFLAHQTGSPNRPFGHRHFPKGDFTVYHRPAGSIFLKTLSTRTHPTESIIGENQKGTRYLHGGDHYIVQQGNEYTGLQPVWQWDQLPGLTIAADSSEQETSSAASDSSDGQSKSRQHQTEFVGGVSDGQNGLTAMNYVRTTQGKQPISIRKAWFFHDDLMICLLGGRKHKRAKRPLTTSLEQCRLQGQVTSSQRKNQISIRKVLTEGDHPLKDTQWLLHNQIGYLPIEPTELSISLGPASGSWSSINHRYDDEPNSVSEPVLSIQLPQPKNQERSGFAILLDATPEKLDSITDQPNWTILRNDRDCQAIRFDSGLHLAAFYAPGALEAHSDRSASDQSLTVNQPCLALWNSETLHLVDPTHKGGAIEVKWREKDVTLSLPPEGRALAIPKG